MHKRFEKVVYQSVTKSIILAALHMVLQGVSYAEAPLVLNTTQTQQDPIVPTRVQNLLPSSQNNSQSQDCIYSFEDINTDPYRNEIQLLVTNCLVQGIDNKFLPYNDVRGGDFVKLFINAYATTNPQSGIQSNAQMSVQQALEIAHTKGIRIDNSFKDQLITLSDIQSFVSTLPTSFRQEIRTQVLQDFKQSDIYLKRNELAYIITEMMTLGNTHGSAPIVNTQGSYQNAPYVYRDVQTHPYADQVQLLAQYGILQSCTSTQLCLNAPMSRGEFIHILMSTSPHAVKSSKDEQISYHYADVLITKYYSTSIQLAQSLGILDMIEVKEKGLYKIDPERTITQGEAIVLLGTLDQTTINPLIMQSLPAQLTKADALTLLLEHHSITAKQLQNTKTSLTFKNEEERTVLQALYESLKTLFEGEKD